MAGWTDTMGGPQDWKKSTKRIRIEQMESKGSLRRINIFHDSVKNYACRPCGVPTSSPCYWSPWTFLLRCFHNGIWRHFRSLGLWWNRDLSFMTAAMSKTQTSLSFLEGWGPGVDSSPRSASTICNRKVEWVPFRYHHLVTSRIHQ